MKNWSKFNEKGIFKSTEEWDIEELTEHVYNIRDTFIDFEQLNIVESYSFGYSGSIRDTRYEPKAGYGFMPGGGLSIEKVVEEWAKFFKIPGGIERLDRSPFIKVYIKFPSNEQSVINSEGIKLFESILEANSRLVDMGYNIMLDMNANHSKYKPMTFKIYFKFKGDPI